MFKTSLSLLLIFSFASLASAEIRSLPLDSKISDVTVFTDRALITREASTILDQGTTRLVFGGLPPYLDPASIQANGKGNAILRDVGFQTIHSEVATDEMRRAIMDQKQKIEDDLSVLTDQKSNLEKERALVEKLSDSVGNKDGEEGQRIDLKEWPAAVEFYRKRLDALSNEIRTVDRSAREVRQRLGKVTRDLEQLGSGVKESSQISVLVESKSNGKVSVEFSYVVQGPSWSPAYELRVNSEKATMQVGYFGVVQQSTPESWEGVRLKLSTAQPQAGGKHPELQPWRLHIYDPIALSQRGGAKKAAVAAAPAMQQMMENSFSDSDAKDARQEPQTMEMEQAQVVSSLTTTIFEIPTEQTVKNDNQPARVPVGLSDLAVSFRHSAVPKLVPGAFLKAKAKNNSSFPLLPGRASVFFDGNFVSTTDLELVAIGEEFWTFLGTDPQVSVTRELVNRLHEVTGLIQKEDQYTYEYLFKIKNQKKTDVELVLWDQLPLAGDDEIHVEIVEPSYSKDTEALKKNNLNNLEWLLKLKPGEELKMPFKFTVSYPQGKQVAGLN